MSNENINKNASNFQEANKNNCTNCKLFVKDAPYGNSTSDYCRYFKKYLNNYCPCKYYTDVSGPYIDFKKKFKENPNDGEDSQFATI